VLAHKGVAALTAIIGFSQLNSAALSEWRGVAALDAIDGGERPAHQPIGRPGRSSIAQSAGLRVSALTAEMSTAAYTATANWR
jgi:hypothetical protein